MVRSPLLPFEEWLGWSSALHAPVDTAGAAEAEYATRRAALGRELRARFARPELREALFTASPGLARRVVVWLGQDRSDEKLERTLVRYFARMTSRETPLGLFAGCSLGRVAEVTRLELRGREQYRRHSRVDLAHLIPWLTALGSRNEVREQLEYEPNSTLHPAFGRWRFARLEPAAKAETSVSEPVLEVERTAHLDAALRSARPGARFAEIASAVDAPGAVHAGTLPFLHALVEHGLLVPAWLPAVTGDDPLAATRRALSSCPALQREAQHYTELCQRFEQLDHAPIGTALEVLESERGLLEPGATEPQRPIAHVDLIKPGADLRMDPQLAHDLLRAAELVQHTSCPGADPRLERFRERFVERFGSRFIALGEALDGDLGVGFEDLPSRPEDVLVADLGLDASAPSSRRFRAIDALRLELLTRALQRGERKIELGPEELERFPARKLEPLPESFAILAQLAQTQQGLRVIAPTIVAPSGISTLARFCFADASLAEAVRMHAELEQQAAGDCVLCDVAHLPDGQAGNILLRPCLRPREILYGGRSGAGSEAQLPLSDLVVGVQGGRVVLRSERLGQRLSVRITNAHDTTGWWQLPVYRFLGALQDADRGALAARWSWGVLANCPFLPRVSAGDIVLSRARWNLTPLELGPALRAAPARAFALLQQLRQQLAWPRWLLHVSGEQRMLLDLDNPLSVDEFLEQCRASEQARLEEMLPAPDELSLHGPEGGFVSEMILPILRRSELVARPMAPAEARAARGHSQSEHAFAPGSEWLYAKIFSGASELPRLLERIAQLLHEPGNVRGDPPRLVQGIRCWFFLPYADPEPHLRLRVRGEPAYLFEVLLPELRRALAPSLDSGAVWRWQLDTYQRELERYGGGAGMELAEELFWIDSEAALALAPLLSADPELRWQITAVGMDRLLADLGFSLPERLQQASWARDALWREFSASPDQRRALGSKYRDHCRRLSELLWGPLHTPAAPVHDELAQSALELLRQRSQRLAPVAARLQAAWSAGEIDASRRDVAASFVHLHAVRSLGLSARKQELVLYDFLRRQYESALQRARHRASPRTDSHV